MSEAYNPPLGSGLCLPGNKESVDTSHSIGKDLDLKGCDLMPFILQTPLNFKMNRQYIGNELISGGFFHSSRLRQDREGRKADKRGTAFSRSHPNSGMEGQSYSGSLRHVISSPWAMSCLIGVKTTRSCSLMPSSLKASSIC